MDHGARSSARGAKRWSSATEKASSNSNNLSSARSANMTAMRSAQAILERDTAAYSLATSTVAPGEGGGGYCSMDGVGPAASGG